MWTFSVVWVNAVMISAVCGVVGRRGSGLARVRVLLSRRWVPSRDRRVANVRAFPDRRSTETPLGNVAGKLIVGFSKFPSSTRQGLYKGKVWWVKAKKSAKARAGSEGQRKPESRRPKTQATASKVARGPLPNAPWDRATGTSATTPSPCHRNAGRAAPNVTPPDPYHRQDQTAGPGIGAGRISAPGDRRVGRQIG